MYRGVQQGDNGQSLMLGGCKPEDGGSAVNDLTYLIMEVSKELKLIDPKSICASTAIRLTTCSNSAVN